MSPAVSTEGSVHSWDIATGVDGPGTRFVTFLAGCPLRCLYCHNPDTWAMRHGKRMNADDILAEAAKYVTFIKASGGGATIGGGEPLLQPGFTGELLRRFKELGLHTALDTSGYLGVRATDQLLADTDLVLLDIKSGLSGTYRRVTGKELEPTLRFAEHLAELGNTVWVRYVLVPGLTDEPENVEAVAAFAAGLGNVERVDVLPFHRLGQSKWDALGRTFPLADTPPPSPELVARVKEQFSDHGLYAV